MCDRNKHPASGTVMMAQELGAKIPANLHSPEFTERCRESGVTPPSESVTDEGRRPMSPWEWIYDCD